MPIWEATRAVHAGSPRARPRAIDSSKKLKGALVLALLPSDHAQDAQRGGAAALIAGFCGNLRASSPSMFASSNASRLTDDHC